MSLTGAHHDGQDGRGDVGETSTVLLEGERGDKGDRVGGVRGVRVPSDRVEHLKSPSRASSQLNELH